MSDSHYNEYRNYPGSGTGIKRDSKGNIISYRYKTSADHNRFMEGLKPLKTEYPVIEYLDDKIPRLNNSEIESIKKIWKKQKCMK